MVNNRKCRGFSFSSQVSKFSLENVFFFFFREKKGLSACLNREFKTKDRKEKKKKKKSYRCILYSVHYGLHLNHSGQHHPFFLFFFFSFWSGGWWWRRRQQQNTLPHANRQRPTRKKSKGWSQKDGEIIIIKKTRPKSTAESSFAVSSVLFFKFFVFFVLTQVVFCVCTLLYVFSRIVGAINHWLVLRLVTFFSEKNKKRKERHKRRKQQRCPLVCVS